MASFDAFAAGSPPVRSALWASILKRQHPVVSEGLANNLPFLTEARTELQ
jgi:hypothetical protein